MAAKKNHNKPTSGKKAEKRTFLSEYGSIIFGAVVVAVIAVLFFSGNDNDFTSTSGDTGTGSAVSDSTGTGTGDSSTAVSADYYADIEIEGHGTITIALDGSAAPITVKNFVDLAEDGFYDGLTFHRIMNGFMMQGGDPNGNGNGTGGSDTKIKGEFSANGVDNPLSHTRGAVSMARAKAKDSASSQFFIVHEDSLFLDGQYAAFGYVTEGMDIVDTICTTAQPTDDNGTIPADEQPVIKTITIREA